MSNYKQLCVDILRYWDAAGTPSDFIDTDGYGTIQRIRAALAAESSKDASDNNHPITPPPDLLQEWCLQGRNCISELDARKALATQAARWGFNQHAALNEAELQKARDEELEAICEWLDQNTGRWDLLAEIRAARRPKPPSLKEQALEALKHAEEGRSKLWRPVPADCDIIRRALESLPD